MPALVAGNGDDLRPGPGGELDGEPADGAGGADDEDPAAKDRPEPANRAQCAGGGGGQGGEALSGRVGGCRSSGRERYGAV